MARFQHKPIAVDAYRDGDRWIVTGPGGYSWAVDDAQFRAYLAPLDEEARQALRGEGPAATPPGPTNGPPTSRQRPSSQLPTAPASADESPAPHFDVSDSSGPADDTALHPTKPRDDG